MVGPALLGYSITNRSDASGLQTPSKEVFKFIIGQITGVEETAQLPTHFDLAQNYPNPFNLETTFKYQLPKDAYVKLEIYNLPGVRAGGNFAG